MNKAPAAVVGWAARKSGLTLDVCRQLIRNGWFFKKEGSVFMWVKKEE